MKQLFLAALLLASAFSSSAGSPDADTLPRNREVSLRTAEGKDKKLPYSHMALNARFAGTAIADPEWYNWCISPIMGKDGKVHVFAGDVNVNGGKVSECYVFKIEW